MIRRSLISFLALVVLSSCQTTRTAKPADSTPLVATFSIAAVDPKSGEIGVAVASKVPAVGAIVPFVKAGTGAVATQSLANVSYGPRGLSLLEMGLTPEETLAYLSDNDPGASRRQVGIVTAEGKSATHTGDNCIVWAGGRTGLGYAIQGNILTGPEVIEAMEKAWLASEEKLFPDRLLAALKAGDEAGGDQRGKQSAALVVHREGWGYAGVGERFRDLRVDDHEEPVLELERLLEVHRGIFKRPR